MDKMRNKRLLSVCMVFLLVVELLLYSGKVFVVQAEGVASSLSSEELRETAAMIAADTSPDLGVTAKAAVLMEADRKSVV